MVSAVASITVPPLESTDAPDAPIDTEALNDWIGDRLPGHGRPLRAARMGQGVGVANALYWLRLGPHNWVLRRPPAVLNAPGASDMLREWRILTTLEGTPVPHPQSLLLGDSDGEPDGPLTGRFLIMAKVDGVTPVGALPAPYDEPARRAELAYATVDAIVELSQVDWRARGLDGLGRSDGFLARQVPRWLHQLDGYRTRDIPGPGPGRRVADRQSPGDRTDRPARPAATCSDTDFGPRVRRLKR